MRRFFLIPCLFLFQHSSCQPANINFTDAIQAEQKVFPNSQDKKWNAIKALENYKADFVCDSLFSIYMSIDTAKRGFSSYYDVLFNTLVNINTPKSASIIEKIYSTKRPVFLFQSTISNLSNHRYYEKLFPGILHALEPDIMNAHLILELLEKGIVENKIAKSDVASYLPKLKSFYTYSKIQRDIPAPKEGLILNIYYWISSPVLARCLAPIKNDKAASVILTELLNDNKQLRTQEEKRLFWQAYKVIDSPIQSDMSLSSLCKERLFRHNAYQFLKEKNKLDYFPKEYNTQEALSEMLCVSSQNLRRHDTNKPHSTSYIGSKIINDEHYYFYWVCWWANCESNSIVVVGPQPLDKSKFNDTPKLKGENVKEQVDKTQLQKAIAEYQLQ
jgi:hypothetical protein